MCDCGTETEAAENFSLRCPFFATERQKLLNNVFDKHFLSQNLNEESMIDILLYGCDRFNERGNKEILLHTIDYINLLNVLLLLNLLNGLFYYYFHFLILSTFFVFLLPLFTILTFYPN